MDGSFKSKRILVTGGAGFVGSNVANRLQKEKAKVTVLDNLFTGREEFLNDGIRFVYGNVTDPILVQELIYKHDIIVHCAVRNIIVSTKEPIEDYDTNLLGTLNVLNAMKKAGRGRLIYTSSASVYGNALFYPTTELEVGHTLTPYAASKLSSEHFCQCYYSSFGVESVSLRLSNVYGTNQSPQNPYCGVMSKVITAISKDEKVTIFGDGRQSRDFCYIDDVVNAVLLAAKNDKAIGKVYNVASGTDTKIEELVAIIAEAMNSRADIEYKEKRDIDTIYKRQLAISKIMNDLSWNPGVDLRSGIEKTIKWLREKNEINNI